MRNAKKENTEKTAAWLNAVLDICPAGDYKQFKSEIIERCGWKTRMTLSNKLRNISPITLPEQAVIKQLCVAHNIKVDFAKNGTCTVRFIKPVVRKLIPA